MRAVPKYLARVVGSSVPSAGGALRPPHFLFGPVGLPLADGPKAPFDAVGSDNVYPSGADPNGPSLNGPSLGQLSPNRPGLIEGSPNGATPNEPGASFGPTATRGQRAREGARANPVASTRLEPGPLSLDKAGVPAAGPLSRPARRPVGRQDTDGENLADDLPGGNYRQIKAPASSASPVPTVSAREALPPGSAGAVATNVPAPVVGDGQWERITEGNGEIAAPPVTAPGPNAPSVLGPRSAAPPAPPELTYAQTRATGAERDEPVRPPQEAPAARRSPGDPREALLPVPGLWYPYDAGAERAGRPLARSRGDAPPSVPRASSARPTGHARVTIGTIEVNVVPAPPPFAPIVAPPVRPAPGDNRTVVDVARLGAGRWFGTGQG